MAWLRELYAFMAVVPVARRSIPFVRHTIALWALSTTASVEPKASALPPASRMIILGESFLFLPEVSGARRSLISSPYFEELELDVVVVFG